MNTKPARVIAASFARFAFCCCVFAVHAQDPTESEPSAALLENAVPTLEQLGEQRATVEADTSLSEAQKATALSLYDRALRAVRAVAELDAQGEALRQRVSVAPARIAELSKKLELESQEFELAPERYAETPGEELVELTETARRDHETAWDTLLERRNKIRRMSLHPLGDPGSPGGREVSPADKEATPELRADGGARDAVEIAREHWQSARAAEARARRRIARERLASFDVLLRLSFLEVETAVLEVRRRTVDYESLVRALDARRAEEARVAREKAQETETAMLQLPDAIWRLARDNLALWQEIEDTLKLEADASRLMREARSSIRELEADIDMVALRLEWVGPSRAVGRLIRDRIEGLPSLIELEQDAASRDDERARLVERRVDLGRKIRRLLLPETTAPTILETISDDRRKELGEYWVRGEVRRLLLAQQDSSEKLYAILSRYLWILASLDDTESRIDTAVRRGLALAREDLLWIPDLPQLSSDDLRHLRGSWLWLSSGDDWNATLKSALESFRVRPWTNLSLLAVLVALVAIRPRCRRRLRDLAEPLKRLRTDAFRYTLGAAVYTVVLAAAWPLGLIWAGWLALSEPWSGDYSVAVGQALITAGEMLAGLTLLRWVSLPEGLSRHFRWPDTLRIQLRHELRWFTPVFVSASALVVLADQAGIDNVTLAIGRPAVILAWLAFALLIWRLLGPRSTFSTYLRELKHPPLAARWRHAWYPVLQGVPVLLALSSGLGYHYAAVEISGVLVRTLWLIVGLLLLRDVLLRWFYVAERRGRLEAALRHREEARAERERAGEAAEGEDAGVEVEVEEIDYRELGEQGRAVVQAGVVVGALLGLWALWGNLLPAVGLLERVELPMSHTKIVEGIAQQVPITLSDLGLALIVLAAVMFTARNLGGLLGFTMLQRLRLDPGTAYAIVTLCQYLLVGGGLIYAFTAIGLQWSKLQWLVAALGVGLGFGLQEIVANFVSGIILLLERPVRPGDIVTVGDADGTVTRIRIRATTIVTFDNKELLVPNKEFITTRVLNWTLSDAHMRLFILVGVAYGSDVKKARQLILEAAKEAEYVMDDPVPSVTFGSFGDSALVLELRCYLPNFDNWHATRNVIHNAIYEKLAKAGITISFPQRDVHLDVSGPLDVRVRSDDGTPPIVPRPASD